MPVGDDLAMLYANHRRFLEAQRGALTRHDGFDAIAGDIPSFQIAMLNDAAALDAAARARPTLFVPPWAPVAADHPALARRSDRLTHMRLDPAALRAPVPHAALTIVRARNETDVLAFTDVQSKGFALSPDGVQELRNWFTPKNLSAAAQDDQAFWILREHGAPVSVLLTVDTGDVLGIYAVATPPELRRRGFCSHLLSQICLGAAAKTVCLQVTRGSDAERLYATLGFREAFIVDVWESAVYQRE